MIQHFFMSYNPSISMLLSISVNIYITVKKVLRNRSIGIMLSEGVGNRDPLNICLFSL